MQELVDEILLAFPRDFGCGFCNQHTVFVMDCFLDIEQTHFHVLLIRDVVVFAELAEVAVLTHPLKETVLTYLVAVLRD